MARPADSKPKVCAVLGSTTSFGAVIPDATTSWNPAYLTQAFARLAARSGVPRVRLHDLRHFVATRLLANGVDVRTVAGRLGHRNPNVTLNVYAHFLPEADRDAAGLLGRLLTVVSTDESTAAS